MIFLSVQWNRHFWATVQVQDWTREMQVLKIDRTAHNTIENFERRVCRIRCRVGQRLGAKMINIYQIRWKWSTWIDFLFHTGNTAPIQVEETRKTLNSNSDDSHSSFASGMISFTLTNKINRRPKLKKPQLIHLKLIVPKMLEDRIAHWEFEKNVRSVSTAQVRSTYD